MSVVIVAPGQGSQTPGFLEPWLAEPAIAAHLGELAEASGVDLAAHGTTSDADTIRDTAVAQPLIVAASLLSLRAVLGDSSARAGRLAGIAGHSVGELAAAAITGVISADEAVTLAALRGSEIAVVVRTERTGDHPIFFQGPGASADVTAAVVLADVVRAAEAMR